MCTEEKFPIRIHLRGAPKLTMEYRSSFMYHLLFLYLTLDCVLGDACTYNAETFLLMCENSSIDEYHAARTANYNLQVNEVTIKNSKLGSVESLMFDSGAAAWNQNIAKITLSDNDISAIDSNGFYFKNPEGGLMLPLPKVTYIDLRNNKLTTIDSTMLRFLPITQLFLSYNLISTLQNEAFSTLQALTHLYLDHNNISIIKSQVFKGLANMVHLNLAENTENYKIELGALQSMPNLEYLSLSNNNLIVELGAFTGLKSLSNLDIANNSMQVAYLEPLLNLQVLNIDHNPQPLWQIPRIPDYLPKLQNLSMSGIYPWNCLELLDVVVDFRNKGVNLILNEPETLKINVEGIECNFA